MNPETEKKILIAIGAVIVLVIGAVIVLVIGAVVWKRTQGAGGGGGLGRKGEFQQKWEFAAGPISAGLALGDDGTLYAGSEDGSVYALDAAGKVKWKFAAGPTVEAPALGTDGTLYFANQDQMIFAVRRDGTQQWAWGGGPFANKHSPWRAGALDLDHFYTPWRGQIRAVRLDTGRPDWPSGYGFEDDGALAILPNGLVAYTGPGWIDTADSEGKAHWQYPVIDPPITVDYLLAHNGHPPRGKFFLDSGMAVNTDGTVYAAAQGSRLVALAPEGTLKWEVKTQRPATNYASPVIAADGTIYFACGDGTVYAMSPNGSQKWTLDLHSQVFASPVLAQDGTLFVVTGAAVHAVSPQGKSLAETPFTGISTSSPTLGPDGALYVASHNGKISAYATPHGGLMNSPWPKFQRDAANSGRAQAW